MPYATLTHQSHGQKKAHMTESIWLIDAKQYLNNKKKFYQLQCLYSNQQTTGSLSNREERALFF